MRKTKIICTIGPASQSIDVLRKLIRSGMNVARLNFSHGTHQEHADRMQSIRQAAREEGRMVAILLDTKGPEIRTGMFKGDHAVLAEGQELVLTTEEVMGDAGRISVSYTGLPGDVEPGDTILIDDGLIDLEVRSVHGKEITCLIRSGGEISNQKGVNVPGKQVRLPAVTEKDVTDILFGIAQGVDIIAASFTRDATTVLEIRRILEEKGATTHIIAKIENRGGVQNIDEIIQVADGVMVARGDLGVEIAAEEVPLVQKMIVGKCHQAGKPVITATQMLESMIRNPRPTRAEASDVANAIFDGTDAVMLSGETAAGRFPVEAVCTMARIAERTEEALHYREILQKMPAPTQHTVTDAISYAACNIALDLRAAAIIAPTTSGSTARMISKYRPLAPIIAACQHEEVLRKLSLVWGVHPLMVTPSTGTDDMIKEAVDRALDAGFVQAGDLLVITAGVPVGVPGTTNLIKVHIIGEIVARGTGIGHKTAVGTVRIVVNGAEAEAKVQPGDILVTSATDRDYVPAMQRAGAVITEAGGLTSHAAVVGLSLGTPVVVGVEGATTGLEDGITVTVDGRRGLIYRGVTRVL